MNKALQKVDFSDWLVVSDIDGTLNNKLRRLPKKNYEAIDQFVNTYNGHFTLASGRNIASMRKHYERLPLKGTPAVILNGAGVYDYANERMLWYNPIGEEGIRIVKKTLKKFPTIEVQILTIDRSYLVHAGLFAGVMALADALPHTRCHSLSQVPKENWGKVIFLGPPALVSMVKKYLLSFKNPHVQFMSSSVASFEMLAENTHKGIGVLKVAEILGIDKNRTAAIGDYFNDYDMLKTVHLSACCAQAPRKMHEIVKYEACHCNKGAVADLLHYLINDYKEV